MKYKGNLSTKLLFPQKDENALTTLLHLVDHYTLILSQYHILITSFCILLAIPGTCRTRGSPENGIELGTFKYLYKSGDNATFGCNFGYTMVGEATLSCINGVWSSDLPFCYGKLKEK